MILVKIAMRLLVADDTSLVVKYEYHMARKPDFISTAQADIWVRDGSRSYDWQCITHIVPENTCIWIC